MFRKFFIFALFATCLGYAFADSLPPVLKPDGVQCTYDQAVCSGAATGVCCNGYLPAVPAPVVAMPAPAPVQVVAPQVPVVQGNIPVWPAPGSDADMQLSNTAQNLANAGQTYYAGDSSDNIKIVSKIGADLVVQNNIDTGTRGGDAFTFSGGANMTQDYQAPQGFNIYENQAEMPLMHAEMLEDDGAAVLAMARSGRVRPQLPANVIAGSAGAGGGTGGAASRSGSSSSDIAVEDAEDNAAAAESKFGQDQVKSWVVASGQTLRSVLQDWCNKEGWDLVWGTNREYPIEASAVFKGRFIDVASALVRNFTRANPIPYAKFYKGNRVVVVSTMDGD